MTNFSSKRRWQIPLVLVSSMAIGVALVAPASADSGSSSTTTNVTVTLTDSNGAALSGGAVKYYGKANGSTASNWHTFGTTGGSGTTSLDITPGKITVEMIYKHTRQTKQVTVSGTSDFVDFQTTPATVSLKDSQGAPIAGAEAQYYGTATAWQSMGLTGVDGTATSEVLPGSISFAVDYKGGRESEKVTVSGPTTVDFQTKAVTLKLDDQNDNPLAGGAFELYGLAKGGWIKPGTTGANGTIEIELLNGSYTVHMTHNKKLQKVTVVVSGGPAGHTFVVEVDSPVVPTDPDNGNDDGGQGGQGDNDGNNEDGNLPVTTNPVDDDPQTPPAIDNEINEFPAVKPGSQHPVAELNDDKVGSQAPTDEAENNDEDGTLAKTGSETTLAGGIGALLLLLGLGLVGASRRSKTDGIKA